MPTQRSTRQRAAARSNGRSASDSPSDVEVRRGVEEIAAPLGDRLPEMVAAISVSLRDDIPELRDEAQLPCLMRASRATCEERSVRVRP
jgi:DNA-binding IclR family transcriptional regulator